MTTSMSSITDDPRWASVREIFRLAARNSSELYEYLRTREYRYGFRYWFYDALGDGLAGSWRDARVAACGCCVGELAIWFARHDAGEPVGDSYLACSAIYGTTERLGARASALYSAGSAVSELEELYGRYAVVAAIRSLPEWAADFLAQEAA